MADDQIPPMDSNLTNTTNSQTEIPPEPQPVIPENPSNPSTTSNPPDIPDPSIPSSPSDPSVSSPPVESAPIPEPVPTPEPEPKPQPQINIPDLSFPFYGSVSPSLSFGQIPDDERIKQKFREWGIVGHNGLDFPLLESTEVLACGAGKIIQSGENGDYGVCVTLQHPWGQSLYAHLKETKVSEDQEVNAGDVVGISSQTGAAFGAHLHFGIKPNNPNESNGHLGFIDPTSYLPNTPIPPNYPDNPVLEPEKPKEEPAQGSQLQPEQTQAPEPTEKPQPPQTLQISEEEIQDQVNQKLALELEARRQKANEARKENREEHLAAIEKFLGERSEITNQDVRDLVHVSQTTATEYLSSLVKSGRIKVEGKGRATIYKNIFE